MHYRARYKLTAVPFVVVTVCLVALVAVLWAPHLGRLLSEQIPILPQVVIGVASLIPIAFLCWYMSSYVDINRGVLRVRSVLRLQRVNLRKLSQAEIFGRRDGKKFKLILFLADAEGRQLFLPLDTWRDEDLIMARVLRATVERRVKIEGEPMLVRGFSRLLDTYKSWDRQQAA
ncbi:MAG: hypothetical protein ABI200_05265 [Gaiellales bacterium]